MLVGGQRMVVAGLRLLLQSAVGFTVVGDESMVPRSPDGRTDGTDIPLPRLDGTSTKADVIILDIDHGAEGLLPVLSPSVPRGTRMLILSSSLDQNILALAFRHGVTGAVLKQEAPEVLLEAVRKVHEGQIWLNQSSTTQLVTGLSATPEVTSPEARRSASLTRRERQVVALVGEGLRNLKIARRLNISEVTVRNHLTSIFRKLKLSSRFQLALYAFKYGLSKLPPKFRTAWPPAAKSQKARKRSAS